jgi:hypothetical protein
MQHLDLSDDEAASLIKELHDIIQSDRYPFSERIRTLKAILAKLRPETVREPLAAAQVYALPKTNSWQKTVRLTQICLRGRSPNRWIRRIQ